MLSLQLNYCSGVRLEIVVFRLKVVWIPILQMRILHSLQDFHTSSCHKRVKRTIVFTFFLINILCLVIDAKFIWDIIIENLPFFSSWHQPGRSSEGAEWVTKFLLWNIKIIFGCGCSLSGLCWRISVGSLLLVVLNLYQLFPGGWLSLVIWVVSFLFGSS